MKKPLYTYVVFILSIFFSQVLFAQPANDNCGGAVNLPAATPVAGTVWNATATGSIPVGCAIGNPDDDVWYKFTTASSGGNSATISLSSIGTDLDATGAMVQLFSASGTCSGFTSLDCTNGDVAPLVINSLFNNTTYYIRVYSYGTGALASSAGSQFTITFTPSTNDNCSGAITLSASTPVTGTVWNATATGSIPVGCAIGNPDDDVWYKFTTASSGGTSATISLSSIGTNLYATGAMIQLFSASGACSGFTSLDCANGGLAPLFFINSLANNTTYYIRVYSYATGALASSAGSRFTITFTPSTNDNCSGAVTLSAATPVTGTVWNATATGSIPVGCASGNPDDDVWYKFTTAASNGSKATIALPTMGNGLQATGAMIQLFSASGACSGFTSLACANGEAGPLVINTLNNNTTYYVRVYSYATGALASSAGSAFTITFTPSIAPSNDDCSNAILLPTATSRFPSFGWLSGATTSGLAPLPTCDATVNYDVWYKFIADRAVDTIRLLNSTSGSVPGAARIQLLRLTGSDCSSLTNVQCGTSSITATGLTIGSTYYIRVYSNGSTPFTPATTDKSFHITVTYPNSLPPVADSTLALFNVDTVAKNLGYPWEITYGPDDSLWITESKGYRVLRISSNRTQAKLGVAPQQVLKLPFGGNGNNGPTFDRNIGTWPQGGMEGLAIHPEFNTGFSKQLVYLAYVYAGTCPSMPWPPPSNSPCIFRTKIVRCQFYFAADAGNPTSVPRRDTLVILDTVISNLPGSNDHNSGRLVVGPTTEGPDNKYKLYYTIGDMGAGQFNNDLRTNHAQNKDTCEGKILRLNTEPDTDASFGVTHDYNTWRKWIPNDNPFTHSVFTTLRTPIYSYGHRNAQGLAWGNVNGTWRLYSSEHGDQSSDEVNVIQVGKNYGWPKVTGVADNNYTTYDNLTNDFTQNDILANQTANDESTFADNNVNFVKPIFDFFNWTPAQIEAMNTGNIFTWSTIAPSGIDFYKGNIPGWKNSLLVTSLKYGLFRLKLKSTGDLIDSTTSINGVDTFPLLHGWRIRDMAVNPVNNSGQFWFVTDSSGSTSGPTGGFSGLNQGTQNGGRVLRLTYKTLLTLPVNFLTFNGKLLTDKTIRLDWKAETDQNHNYFEVEKSANSSSFVSIGTVSGNLLNYNLIDPSPFTGNNYYRIKEVSRDGKAYYSKVINIVYDPYAYLITIYPNPIKDVLSIKIASPRADNIQIEITDMQGRRIYKENRFVNNGTTEITVDAKKWASQLYSLKIIGGNNNLITTEKIIKQ